MGGPWFFNLPHFNELFKWLGNLRFGAAAGGALNALLTHGALNDGRRCVVCG